MYAEKKAHDPLEISTTDNRQPQGAAQREADDSPRQQTQGQRLAQMQTQHHANGLPAQLRQGIESLSGFDMSDVRVHRNSDKPAQLQAHAYAQGSDIYLGPGQDKHLPHEAWHVVQQKQGRVRPTLQMKGGVGVNDDVGLEREADVMGGRVLCSAPQNGGHAASLVYEKKGVGHLISQFMFNFKAASSVDFDVIENNNLFVHKEFFDWYGSYDVIGFVKKFFNDCFNIGQLPADGMYKIYLGKTKGELASKSYVSVIFNVRSNRQENKCGANIFHCGASNGLNHQAPDYKYEYESGYFKKCD
ncbi:DUF4157 domain-containing protein [Paludibacterium purpuratum]|uniref:Uncharacterized protein DUF4157 n=1 Tax=Paludibacterium purpuratum TaxID=1144873 RepID=A0A4R7BET6_9NEIS|nr:DUF4157 domain-containing protein [Paludibacterium purpuratum]TDR82782.1 uncharacterized protein DUF4157 [Paludibacterium purpuratum]